MVSGAYLSVFFVCAFLRATAYILSSVRLSVRLSVRHTGRSYKNGWR